MKRVKLVISYDGTNYCGWQIQSNGTTVQEVLNRNLSELLGEPIWTMGASRTDSGVHALGNVAVFDTTARIPADKISYALNQRLPEDIRIQSSEETPPDFHPRYCNSIKTYEYKILNRKFPIPVLRYYTHFTYIPLDLSKMREGGQLLLGEHDFKSFCGIGAQVKTTVRTIYNISITQECDLITIHIEGSGFLYNMVRIIAGTLMEVGSHSISPNQITDIIRARNRETAGPTAPAKGLVLVGIKYEE